MLVKSKHYWSFCNIFVIACMIVLASRSISKSRIHKRILFLMHRKHLHHKNALGRGCPLQQKWPIITGSKKPSVHSSVLITTWRHKAINAWRSRYSNKAVTATYLIAVTVLLEYLNFLLTMFDAIFLVNLIVILQESLVSSK